jgi:hypothetical protein
MAHDFTKPPGSDGPYKGPERRSGVDRRKTVHDRREEIRFELQKQPRRSGQDRRKNAWDKAPSR